VAFFWFPSVFRTKEKEEPVSTAITLKVPKPSPKKINTVKVTPPKEGLDSFGWNKKPVKTNQYPILEKLIDYFRKYTLIGFIVSNVDEKKVVHAFEDLADDVKEFASPEDDS
jgi:hypothetical protein